MKVLDIKGLRIGEGRPKTIVSLMGEDSAALVATANKAIEAGVDCLEWRADFFAKVDDVQAMAAAYRELCAACPRTPIILTVRTKGQGGQVELDAATYASLLGGVLGACQPDFVDIETWIGDAAVTSLVEAAHARGIYVIVSCHDFSETPAEDEMEQQLLHMAELGADVPKMAVMARRSQDAHALMRATARAREQLEVPLLTMAMGTAGQTTRLTGEVFGSALTFCALGKASAPGQVELAQALVTLNAIHAMREVEAADSAK